MEDVVLEATFSARFHSRYPIKSNQICSRKQRMSETLLRTQRARQAAESLDARW